MRASPSLLGCVRFILVWATLFGDVSLGVRGDGSDSAAGGEEVGLLVPSAHAARMLRQLAVKASTAKKSPSPRKAKRKPKPKKSLATAKVVASPKKAKKKCPKGKRCPSPKKAPKASAAKKAPKKCPKGKRCPSPKKAPKKCPKGKRCPSPKKAKKKCPKGKRCPSPKKAKKKCPKGKRCPSPKKASPSGWVTGKKCPKGKRCPSPKGPGKPAVPPPVAPPPVAPPPVVPVPSPSPGPEPIGAPPTGTPPATLYLCKRFWVADQSGTYDYFKSNFTAAFANLAAMAATTTDRSNLAFGLLPSNYLSRPSSTVPVIGLNVVNVTFQIPVAEGATLYQRTAAMEAWLAGNMRAGALSPNLQNLAAAADDSSAYIKELGNGACIDPATLPPTGINLTYLATTASTTYDELVANLQAILAPAYTAVGLSSAQWVTFQVRPELDKDPIVAWVQALVPAALSATQKADLSWAIQAGLSYDNTLNDERFNRFYPIPPPHL